MKADQHRIRDILKETILALLNNGIEFNYELEVDGLLGVTVDHKDVFLVKISEVVAGLKRPLVQQQDRDSSDEETLSKKPLAVSSSKARRKRRSPSPKSLDNKRLRVASPTQTISSTSQKEGAKGAGSTDPNYAVDIDLTSVKMEPVDTTVSDSAILHAADIGESMADVGSTFDYNQQQPQITSIQAVSQTKSEGETQPGCSSWPGQQGGDIPHMNQQGLAHGMEDWEDDYDEDEDDEDFDEEEWQETMMMQQQLLQRQQLQRSLMPPPARPPPLPHHRPANTKHQHESDSDEEGMEFEDEEEEDLDKSAFDYYKSNPKHPDITKAIMQGSKAVLEQIIGLSALKAAKSKNIEKKERKKKMKMMQEVRMMVPGMVPSIPFVKDTVDAQVIVKQEPLDAGGAELVIRPIPPAGRPTSTATSVSPTHSSTVSSTSTSTGPPAFKEPYSGGGGGGGSGGSAAGGSSPGSTNNQHTNMGPPPPPPPKDVSQDFLDYPAGPPLNTQFSPAAMKGPGGPLKCDICPYTCQRANILQRHRLKEHGEGEAEFTCPDCPGQTFPSPLELAQHLKEAHKMAGGAASHKSSEKSSSTGGKSEKSKKEKGPTYSCDCHGRNFRSAESLADHLKKVSRDECLTCEHCSKVFVRRDALLNHIQNKHGAESKRCKMCTEGFSSEEELNNHLKNCTRSKLEKPDNFFCEECQLEFPTEMDLKDHNKMQHKQTFNCDLCSKTYSSKKTLQTHVKKAHAEEMQCDST